MPIMTAIFNESWLVTMWQLTGNCLLFCASKGSAHEVYLMGGWSVGMYLMSATTPK